jgi:uncharacterized protein (TIGR02300 family)
LTAGLRRGKAAPPPTTGPKEARVSKQEWGTKRICPNCGTRYYDLSRDPIVCPKCSTTFDPEALLKTRRVRVVAPVEEVAAPVVEEEIDADLETAVEGEAEEEVVPAEAGEEEEEEEEEVIEDASELGEDQDDMAEVIENVEDEEER